MVCRSSRGNRHARRGASAVELAITLPLLVLIFVIAFDFSRVFYHDVALWNCARNGALWESRARTIYQAPYANVQAAALADWNQSGTAPTVVAVDTTIGGNPARTVTVTWRFDMLTRYITIAGNYHVDLSHAITMEVLPPPS